MQIRVYYFIAFAILGPLLSGSSNSSEADYFRYLQQFGYTPKLESRRLFSVVDKSSYSDGIKKFQRLYKLPETGEFDERTRKLMQRARCGNPDLGTVNTIKRPLNVDAKEPTRLAQGRLAQNNAPQSYATNSIIWQKKHLKWFIEDYPKRQTKLTSHENIRRIMKQAFDDWEKHSGLIFEMATKKEDADFKIRFESKDHGDGYPFDGAGATLAHAFYPTSGDIHFDDDEHFIDEYVDNTDKYTLRLVAAHEIGHALGLSHSFEENSLMFPVYQPFPANFSISVDDQQGIQTLYGKPDEKPTIKPSKTTATPRLPTRAPDTLPPNNWCPDDFQTGCEGPDGELYLFKHDQVWRYQARRKRHWDPAPTLLGKRFPAFSEPRITACVRSSTGYIYLFKNYRMWRLKTHWSIDGPHILQGENYPQNPRLALLHQNSIYLLRDRLVYRLNEFNHDEELEIRRIDSILNPAPNEYIRSGFTYMKRHYIFTDDKVYVYDSNTGHLLPGYPKRKSDGWFACENVAAWSQRTTEPTDRKHHRKPQRSHRRPFPFFWGRRD